MTWKSTGPGWHPIRKGPDVSATGALEAVGAAPALAEENYVERGSPMLSWALVFAVLALVAGLFGFGFIASGFAAAAKVLFIAFLVLFVVALMRGRRLT